MSMRNYIQILTCLILCNLGCNTSDDHSNSFKQEVVNSALFFYDNYKEDFLRSGLKDYDYNPRMHFEKIYENAPILNITIFRDSSIRVRGFDEFYKQFNIKIDSTFKSDVIISNLPHGDLKVFSLYNNEKTNQIIKAKTIKANPVEYFIQLKARLNKFKIIAIETNPTYKTKVLIFSKHQYLTYLPDSLRLANDDRAQLDTMLQGGKMLDRNWYIFNEERNLDYY